MNSISYAVGIVLKCSINLFFFSSMYQSLFVKKKKLPVEEDSEPVCLLSLVTWAALPVNLIVLLFCYVLFSDDAATSYYDRHAARGIRVIF